MSTKTGMMTGAHETAPGGMSQPALVVELVEEHGWKRADAKALTWPQQIDAVIKGRQTEDDEEPEENEGSDVWIEDDADERAAEEDEDYLAAVEDYTDENVAAVALFSGELDDEVAPVGASDVSGGWDLDDFDDMADEDADDAADAETDRQAGVIEAPVPDNPNEQDTDYPGFDGMEAEQFEDWWSVTGPDQPEDDPHALFIGMPGTKDYIFDGHFGIGPSGAERWMNCTASVGAIRSMLEKMTDAQQVAMAKSSLAARQGTTAHAAAEAEALLMLGRSTQGEYDSTILDLTMEPDTAEEAYSDEMAEWIYEYGQMLKGYADARGGEAVLIESRVSAAVPLLTVDADGDTDVHEITGSADAIVLPDETYTDLVVADLKYGNGVDVTVDGNPQIRIYAIGALGVLVERGIDLPETVTYHIVQPRLGGIKTWTEPIEDLLDWRDTVLSKSLTEALGGKREGAAFVPSDDACQFCDFRGNCAALAEQRLNDAADLFDTIIEAEVDGEEFPETSGLPSDRLGELLAQAQGLVKIADDLKAEVQRRLYRGEGVPGYQLVNYSPPRHWTESAEEALANVNSLHKRTLMSPTQAVKVLGEEKAKRIEKYIVKPDIRPVVAREGDRRKTWSGIPPEQLFTNLDEEDGTV